MNMSDTLVSFETAKLAKEKGFPDILGLTYSQDGRLEGHRSINYPAPTQSLLQKWLREKHDTHIEISLVDNSRTYHWEYTVVTSNDRDFNDEYCFDSAKNHYNNEEFKTFEEALEKGLQEALKLIK